jgi:hypothetical protein
MRRWFAPQGRLEPVFNLFFGTLHHPDLYLEVRFLSYAQAVETYDFRRRAKPGQKTLAERMRDVLDECRTVSGRIVGAEPGDQEEFITDFKNSRNYYTHYTQILRRKPHEAPPCSCSLSSSRQSLRCRCFDSSAWLSISRPPPSAGSALREDRAFQAHFAEEAAERP